MQSNEEGAAKVPVRSMLLLTEVCGGGAEGKGWCCVDERQLRYPEPQGQPPADPLCLTVRAPVSDCACRPGIKKAIQNKALSSAEHDVSEAF